MAQHQITYYYRAHGNGSLRFAGIRMSGGSARHGLAEAKQCGVHDLSEPIERVAARSASAPGSSVDDRSLPETA